MYADMETKVVHRFGNLTELIHEQQNQFQTYIFSHLCAKAHIYKEKNKLKRSDCHRFYKF